MPNFVSPGGMAGGAIEQFLMQRAMDERDAMERQFRQQMSIEAGQRQAEQVALQRQQEARVAQAQAQAQADLENQRAFTRANTIAETAMPNDVVDEQTAELLRAQGFGGQIQQAPGLLQMRGGSRYLNAEAQRQAQAAQAEAARQSAAERANESNQTRLAIAQMGADSRAAAQSVRAETAALRNDLLQAQVDAAKTKATEKEEAKGRAKNAAKVRSQATINVLKELADFDPVTGKATLKPGTANLYGAQNPLARMVPGSDTNNAAASLKRLTGTAIIDLINEMKNQSATGATGFGSLSGSEGKLLETASSELASPLISDERAAAELERMYKMAQQLYGEQPTAAPTPAAGGSLSARDLIEKYRKK